MKTKPRLLLSVFAGAMVFASCANAATFGLTGTIRDFNDSHPDFEAAIGGLDTQAVENTLGADGKPVFNPAGAGVAFSNQANFDQWYNNVPGTNWSAPLAITLDNTITANPNIFTFSDSSFFPIDGQLFGNQGRSNNYHFTYEIGSSFTYQGGETFSFTGDDDLWVFINNQLVVDLGGVHTAVNGSVDLDTLGLIIGNDYSFDLFFAERHTSQSNFRIDTSLQLTQVIPIPATLPLLGTGLAALGFAGWRRRRKTAAA